MFAQPRQLLVQPREGWTGRLQAQWGKGRAGKGGNKGGTYRQHGVKHWQGK